MKKRPVIFATLLTLSVSLLVGCNNNSDMKDKKTNTDTTKVEISEMQKKVNQYAVCSLKTDISVLTDKEKKMIPILIQAADIMNEIFWLDALGDKEKLLNNITDEATKKFVMINYGPWDRMNADTPFVEGFKAKPLGANYYPADITKEEFDAFDDKDKTSWYTVIRRNDAGKLYTIPYHTVYKEQIDKIAELIKQAAELAEDNGLKKYLELRAEALLTDNYLASDLAWMDMKTNTIDFVIGPIENYEDQLFGYKAAHSGQILVKDKVWSDRLAKYNAMLPSLQSALPVEAKYKKEKPNANSDMNVYDVIYYAGDCNAGGKNIAINLPNDPRVHAQKGSRKLQLKNAMQAKFDKILVPIANLLINENQRKHIKFTAFFENTMFHEVAHGLGIKNTLDGKSTVRDALKEYYANIEENKADILGLFLVTKLHEMGELGDTELMDNYVTFMAGTIRSVRFGATSAHGIANAITYNYFEENGAFTRNEKSGIYTVNFAKMKNAISSLGEKILIMQGDGNYEAAKALVKEKGIIKPILQQDLDKIAKSEIAVDIIFEQGLNVLGL